MSHKPRSLRSRSRSLAARLGSARLERRFEQLLARIPERTRELTTHVLEEAVLPRPSVQTDERRLIRQHQELMGELEVRFHARYRSVSGVPRIALHLPPDRISPAGSSIIRNLADGLRYLGVPVAFLPWDYPIGELLRRFSPSVLMTSDHEAWLDRISWSDVALYRQRQPLLVGLTAQEDAEPSELQRRLRWGDEHGVDFYYTYHAAEHLAASFLGYTAHGKPVVPVEFGANPLRYAPLVGVPRNVPYVFLGSAHTEKIGRYITYFGDILQRCPGILIGPGWGDLPRHAPVSTHAHLYGRAMVGLNLHIPVQLHSPNQLNERTYNLAAAGVPQVIDRPALLDARFPPDAVFSADSPETYLASFEVALTDRQEAERRALVAHRSVLSEQTVFHRADLLVAAVQRLAAADL